MFLGHHLVHEHLLCHQTALKGHHVIRHHYYVHIFETRNLVIVDELTRILRAISRFDTPATYIPLRQFYRYLDIAYMNPKKANQILSGKLKINVNDLFQIARENQVTML